jgi:hypothetical protein
MTTGGIVVDRWEFCYVDMLRHEVTRFSAQGTETKKIKKDKARQEDTKDDATGRFVAELGQEGWELASGTADIRPMLFFRKKI